MIDEKMNPDEITEEASDPLGAPDSQEEKDEDFSPDDLSPAQREQYDQAVKAVDDFVANHPEYKHTDENRQAILDYLDEHDLAISPASLELSWEQLQDRLDVEPEKESNQADEARVRKASTAQLATPESEEAPEQSKESEPEEEEPKSARGKPVRAFRNGREVSVGA